MGMYVFLLHLHRHFSKQICKYTVPDVGTNSSYHNNLSAFVIYRNDTSLNFLMMVCIKKRGAY